MKRCIVCGNTGDDNNTVCSACGGSMADVTEETSAKAAAVEKSEAPEVTGEAAPAQKAQKRMKSGPQIYGQTGMTQKNNAPYQGQQGMVRRNIQGGVPQGQPANGPQGRPVRPQGRPMNGPQGQPMRPEGQPMNGPQGRPVNGPQGQPMRPQGQPMNGPQGRPMNGPQGQPMNGSQMRPQGQPMNGPQMRPAQGAANGRYRMQIMETARGMLKSPLFFLIALLNTVYLAGSVAAIFMKELNFSLYAGLLADIQLPEQAAGYMTKLLAMFTKLDTGAVAVNLIIHIPDLLFCLGIWVIFFSALAAKERMSGAGFGLVKIVMILRMVLYCILMLAGLLIAVTLVVAAWISGVQNMLIAAVVTLVLMIVMTMMLIMYYFSYFATMKTCLVNADNGDVYGSVSSYVAGLQIIMALFSVINLLSGIVNAEISNIAGSVGKMGWMILLGIWMFRYKSKLSEFDEQ